MSRKLTSGITELPDGHSTMRGQIERIENWDKMIAEIPSLRFRSEWEVQVIPPFMGAVARFVVRHNGRHVSVYLDWYGQLGAMQLPYYEIYPDADGENSRFGLQSIDRMMQEIAKSLDRPLDESGN
jgi:hypothetical protein